MSDADRRKLAKLTALKMALGHLVDQVDQVYPTAGDMLTGGDWCGVMFLVRVNDPDEPGGKHSIEFDAVEVARPPHDIDDGKKPGGANVVPLNTKGVH